MITTFNRLKVRDFLIASLFVVLSISISVVFGEAVVRMIVDRVDYLETYLVDNDILGHKARPLSSGHDSWGFRNYYVPSSVKIVTVGDSQTYGISAAAKHSWPAQLQQLMHESVYNMSLGGYGPVQYYYLLKTKALDLRPSFIIVGFYFGNDLIEAYNIVYTKDYWNNLRRADLVFKQEARVNASVNIQTHKFVGNFRDWLSHHSVLYRMFTLSIGDIFRFFEMRYSYSLLDGNITILEDKKHNIRTGFTPAARLTALDLRDPKILEGLRLTLELFRQMNDLCLRRGIDFAVVLIPTKETVFADLIGGNRTLKNSSVIDELLANERQVNELMKKYFDRYLIPYIDALPNLRIAVRKKSVYPSNQDGHPNADGYQVIAKSIEQFLIGFKQPKPNLTAVSR